MELEKIPAVRSILDAAGVCSIPTVHTAVLVGTALDPSHSKQLQNMPGITVNTIWGEMAAQLALSVGDLKLYDYVKEADKKGVSPGSETLKRPFDACGSCLVLMDELVAYAKKNLRCAGPASGKFRQLHLLHSGSDRSCSRKQEQSCCGLPAGIRNRDWRRGWQDCP